MSLSLSSPTSVEVPTDSFIASAEAKRLAGSISNMTIWRWAKAGVIPKPMQIRGRNYWRRSEFMRALELAAEDQAPAAD